MKASLVAYGSERESMAPRARSTGVTQPCRGSGRQMPLSLLSETYYNLPNIPKTSKSETEASTS